MDYVIVGPSTPHADIYQRLSTMPDARDKSLRELAGGTCASVNIGSTPSADPSSTK